MGVLTRTDFGFGIPIAPYFGPGERAAMIVHHAGGPLYFSRFDARQGGNFAILGIRPLHRLAPAQRGKPLPPLDGWKVVAANGRAERAGAGLRVHGDSSSYGYQVMSPPIPVEPGVAYRVDLEIFSESGAREGIGVLNKDGNWLQPPVAADQVEFVADGTGGVQIVIANNGPPPPAEPPLFTLEPGYLTRIGSSSYADQLAKCYDPPVGRASEDCVTEDERRRLEASGEGVDASGKEIR
jgi:hypothetical protein